MCDGYFAALKWAWGGDYQLLPCWPASILQTEAQVTVVDHYNCLLPVSSRCLRQFISTVCNMHATGWQCNGRIHQQFYLTQNSYINTSSMSCLISRMKEAGVCRMLPIMWLFSSLQGYNYSTSEFVGGTCKHRLGGTTRSVTGRGQWPVGYTDGQHATSAVLAGLKSSPQWAPLVVCE